jgi:hypothetical protein
MLITLLEFRERVLARIATISAGANLRHKPANINRWINDAAEQYHLIRTESGHPQTTKRVMLTSTASTTAGSHGWPANEVLELPADFLELNRCTRIHEDGRRGVTLDQYAEQQVSNEPAPGKPTHYRLTRTQAEDGTLTPLLQLMRPADAVYSFELIYTPTPTALADDTDALDVYPGTADFIVCSAAMSMLEYDGINEQPVYTALVKRRDEAAGVLRRAYRAARGGVLRMNSRHARFGR